MSLDPHLRWKGEEEGNPGLVARNTEWFFSSRGVRASAGVEVTIIDSQPLGNIMARSNSNMEPSELTLSVATSNFVGSRTFFIDISQCVSLLNRRFYRQGLNWAVGGIKILSTIPGSTGNFVVTKLPTTWVMSNAWEKSMRNWLRMNKEAMEEAGSIRPKFLDYKIYADSDHHDAGFGANLLPANRTTFALPGEWESAKFIIPNSAVAGQVFSREVIATGTNYPGPSTATGLNAVSIIEGYAASRGLPNVLDPNTPADSADADGAVPQNWLTALHNDGTSQDEEVIEDLTSENNIAPYPFENDGVTVDTMYPGGANQLPGLALHDQDNLTGTTIGGTTRIKGGMFPCGLMRFDMSRSHPDSLIGNYIIQIDLVPGNHRGYLCEPMTEM